MNQFKYSLDNKRYHTYNYYLKNKYHQKVAKVALNADFTCPNRDGSKGYGGCIFCSSSGSGDYAGNVHDHLEKQFQTISQIMKRKWPECAYIAYFQANTNTYGPLDKIKKMIQPFLEKEDVKGIALATRPDCLSEEIVCYLSEVNQTKDVYIELGLQTIHDETSKLINRGHTYQEFLDGLALCRQYNLEVCVHIINGLPFETKEMMIETAKTLGQLDIQALKIHMLFVVKNTKLQQMYENHEFEMLTRQEYIDIVVEQLRYINPEIILERLTGDGKIDDLIAPMWSIKKVTILNDIDKQMKERDIYQGDLYKKIVQ
ncbi:TIGR01212 family radical SAM protein [Faecalibacillus faecis]|uniref:TIGR01212 family radical SAM protein n=1 Tax=Faecalibacillus faecis TaxID=1982628 RepID=UPI00066488C6|nr:TIGR01212 family radical SAM protein [Faecalibacillus faecis]KMV79122.1 radical SAM protein [Coprobacillus sp. 8_1_38FAA]RGT61097.1 TIGR01212 family radical SAM protein [Coprobacillus sp. AF18-40]RGT86099.1 TIGR01212 family radical SAM protein [Coprobacillus sp. AF18-15LB]RHB03394.1 TIGR01212 family radical SAM protein [Coprobacillus sp. AM42-12AC]RHH13847.1 TIGR01212 family radical SAM protein [Coprobacillus sp. AM18-4LB-d2]RHP26454.1 TIGR01212 family radical SAM protein [Coprobacillus sp